MPGTTDCWSNYIRLDSCMCVQVSPAARAGTETLKGKADERTPASSLDCTPQTLAINNSEDVPIATTNTSCMVICSHKYHTLVSPPCRLVCLFIRVYTMRRDNTIRAVVKLQAAQM